MENLTLTHLASLKNKETNFPLAKCILFFFLVFSASLLTFIASATNECGTGSDNINQTLTNTGTIIGTVRNIIVITRNGYPGIPTNFDVNMQPVSDAAAVPPTQTICSESQNVAIILTSNVPGISFLWSVTAIPPFGISGFVATSSGNTFLSATISSISSIQGTISYTIIPSFNMGMRCPGSPADYTIIVNPLPGA